MFCVRVPATTANLGPGFDALGLALELYNYIEVTVGAGTGRVNIIVQGEGEGELSRGEDNLVYQAVKRAFRQRDLDPPELCLHLVNNIPLARGLGSSAAAIVGGLRAAQELLPVPFSQDELLALACELEGHPDNVSAALLGGLVISCPDREGKHHYLKARLPESLKLVIAVPELRLSTHDARRVLPEMLPRRDAVFNLSRTALLTASLLTNDLSVLPLALEDRLHQPYRSTLIPGMDAVFAAAHQAGALGVALSGSGPSIVAFAQHNLSAIGRAMVEAFASYGVQARYLLTAPAPHGAEVLPQLRLCTA
ncbi:MAG: homoserine kinase [Bacillota bacterium]|nr:homoserine kinase [Bacillota bacterium]MDK2855725.1 homoserine kinase [Bacillota bacterium]MDK2924695.1 homoserine kinase [Bacillota bacterium]